MFPGLPHLQFLIACSMQNWRCGRPGNEARGALICRILYILINSEVQKTTTNAETDAT